MPFGDSQTAMRFTALRQANERCERELAPITAYREVCDGVTKWYVRNEVEGAPPAQERGVVTIEYVARPGEI